MGFVQISAKICGLINLKYTRMLSGTFAFKQRPFLKYYGRALAIIDRILYYLYMKTLSIEITDIEYTKFGITNNVLSFSDFVDMVSKKLMKENIEMAVKAADLYGLSSMTMDEITSEVQAVRKNAKNYN